MPSWRRCITWLPSMRFRSKKHGGEELPVGLKVV
nr:MAG TPA_asm: hypothetical protein [Caudoviricetes sp.]